MPWRWLHASIRWALALLACALGLAEARLAGAQAPVPVGAEFQVNSYTFNHQRYPSVAAEPDGDFVVVWQSNGSSGTDKSSYSIQGQRYTSSGSTQGAQFQVNTYTTNEQAFPSVATDADGDFVVVWQSLGGSGTDTSNRSIQGQRYASGGAAQGGQFQINSYTTNAQSSPSVAAAANGDFVVSWTSTGSSGTDTAGTSIQGQRYASDGSARGAQFQVNTYTTSSQYFPSVAATHDGDFVVVWASYGSSGTDTGDGSIQGQRYASDGAARGTQFQVNTYTTNRQGDPSVAAAGDGSFVVAWDDLSGLATYGAYIRIEGQRYASDGSSRGAEFQVETHTLSYHVFPAVASAANRDFVVAWQSIGSSEIDLSVFGIEAQRYSVPAAVPPVPSMSPVTRFALVAALLAIGAAGARAYGSVSRRSRFSR